MGDIVCCPLDNGDADPAELVSRETPRARKDHRCCECGEAIPKGTTYEAYNLKERGYATFETYKTCLSCVEIRDHFACGRGWIFGEVWSQLAENFFPDMKAGGPCMDGLSPAARARLFERRLKWLEDTAS